MCKSAELMSRQLHSMYIVGNDFFEKGMKKPEMDEPNRALLGYLISKGVVSFLFE